MIAKISQEKQRAVKRIMVEHLDIVRKANVKSFDRVTSKSYGDRSMETKKQLAYKFLQEYLQCSTIHGVKYLSNLRIRSSIAGKIFWALIMICSFLFSGWMIWKFWTRFNANPTTSVIESFQAPVHMIPFPAITLCPLVVPLESRRNKVLQHLRLPPDIDAEMAQFLVRYGPAFASEHTPGGKDYLDKLKALLRINHLSLVDFLKLLRPCEDLFESCWWDGEKKNCSELFKTSYTVTGICCSFNYLLEDYIETGRRDSDFLRTTHYGPKSGLKVILHRDLFTRTDGSLIRYSTNSIGLVMFPHHPLEYVGTIAVRQILQAEQELWIAVTPSINLKPPGYYRENSYGELALHCADETTKLKYFPTYRYSNCFTSCSIEVAFQICKCVPYVYAPVAYVHSLKVCDWEDWECLYSNADYLRIIQNVKRENFSCDCLNPCYNVYYQIQTSSAVLYQQDFSISPTYKNLSDSQAILKVFLNSENFMIMSTVPIADRLYLLASVGGVFSLFVGCSFISVVEIFYFVGLFLRSSSKKTK